MKKEIFASKTIITSILLVVLVVGGVFAYKYYWPNPNLPDFPENISEYKLIFISEEINTSCKEVEGVNVCMDSLIVRYENNEEIMIQIEPIVATTGRKKHLEIIKNLFRELPRVEIIPSVYKPMEGEDLEEWKIFWISMGVVFMIDEFSPDSNIDVNNEIVKYYLDKYPPEKI